MTLVLLLVSIESVVQMLTLVFLLLQHIITVTKENSKSCVFHKNQFKGFMKQIIWGEYFIKIAPRDTRNLKQNKNKLRH